MIFVLEFCTLPDQYYIENNARNSNGLRLPILIHTMPNVLDVICKASNKATPMKIPTTIASLSVPSLLILAFNLMNHTFSPRSRIALLIPGHPSKLLEFFSA